MTALHNDLFQQNVYDDPDFFEGSKTLRQNDSGLNGALELPAIRPLLPELSHMNLLNLGSGFVDFTRYARAKGAAHVTGIELSTRILAEAQRPELMKHCRLFCYLKLKSDCQHQY